MKAAFRRFVAMISKLISVSVLVVSIFWQRPVSAFTLEKYAGQGGQALTQAINLRFSQPMVALGQKADAPVQVVCDTKVVKIEGFWVGVNEWRGRLDKPPYAGTRCEYRLRDNLKSASGSDFSGPSRVFKLPATALKVESVEPYSGASIDENQIIVLRSNAAPNAAPASLLAQAPASCSSSAFGESIAFKLVDSATRQQVLDVINKRRSAALGAESSANWVVGQCARPLGYGSKVKVTALGEAIEYATHPLFKLTVNCEREQSNLPCVPVRPIRVAFSTPVALTAAAALTLRSAAGKVVESNLALQLKPGALRTAALENEVTELEFAAPFQAESNYSLQLPAQLTDVYGRTLARTEPISVAVGQLPALAKFAANFGIVERQVGALPLTVRGVTPSDSLQLRTEVTSDPAQIVRWLRSAEFERRNEMNTRAVPLLANRKLPVVDLPALNQTNTQSKVLGIPLAKTGLHRVEVQSSALGSLLPNNETQKAPMYVRAYALLTGMAVHLKTSKDNSLVWVTSLETGKPIDNAAVSLADCRGTVLWSGVTNAQGIAKVDKTPVGQNCASDADQLRQEFGIKPRALQKKKANPDKDEIPIDDTAQDANWLVAIAQKDQDLSFTTTQWNQGIEPWRFNINQGESSGPALFAHSIFARTLLRQGEVVHAKHLFRQAVAAGLKRPAVNLSAYYKTVVLTHLGSSQKYEVPLNWIDAASASSQWSVPANAKLGAYSVSAKPQLPAGQAKPDELTELSLGQFAVEQFKLPTMSAVIDIKANGETANAQFTLSYLNGGAAAGIQTQVSAATESYTPYFSGYSDYDFSSAAGLISRRGDDEIRADLPQRFSQLLAAQGQQLLLDKAALTLDARGSASKQISLAKAGQMPSEPQSLRVEVNYPDPNGEIQTLSQVSTLWPSQVVLGFQQSDWFGVSARAQRIVALDTQGKPLVGQAVEVFGLLRTASSVRKRAVGGFYTYENSVSYRDLGSVCAGKTDSLGFFQCEVSAAAVKDAGGSLYLIASSKDTQGKASHAGKSIWFSGFSDDWMAQSDSDRTDVLAQKPEVVTGEIARFQVRMPFEKATALVAVEREGILDTFVVDLERGNPVVEVPVLAHYAPNVVVSVLAIRPRLEPLSWGSFFRWGWRSPFKWWAARKVSQQQPTAMVDLAKPAFRFGMAQLQVQAAAHLATSVVATPAKLEPGQEVNLAIKVALPSINQSKATQAGASLGSSKVAVAVVDEALLELSNNSSWDLLAGLWLPREYGVQTATAQMQVIGKRHFGLKAVAPGGGGGSARGASRELFDTLVYWNPAVALDAQGNATVKFKTNDSLSRFRVVVFSDVGDDLVGVAKTQYTVTKDLQIIAGLTPFLRENDAVTGLATLRNGTDQAQEVQFEALLGQQSVTKQTVTLAAGSSAQVNWPIAVGGFKETQQTWTLRANVNGKNIADQLLVNQALEPTVAARTVAASFARLDGATSIALQLPIGSLADRSLVQYQLSSSVVGSLDSVKQYFRDYQFSCLEQRSSKAVGLRDVKLWQAVQESLPNYLDRDGFASYFPVGEGASDRQGSDVLTAYLLSVSQAAKYPIAPQLRDQMLGALTSFVQGKLQRNLWSPNGLGVNVSRQLTALEALSRYGRATPAMLATIDDSKVASWPTSAVIDWAAVLSRLALPNKQPALDAAWGVLRSRTQITAEQISFDDEARDNWYWMMSNSDTNAARLIDLALETSALGTSKAALVEWLQDMPRLVNGLVKRQKRGNWSTTTANLWGTLALEKYSEAFEKTPVTGTTNVALSGSSPAPLESQKLAWKDLASAANLPAKISLKEATPGTTYNLALNHQGAGRPYVALQLQAAVPITAVVNNGYRLTKTVTPVSQSKAGAMQVGDVFRVDLEIDASVPMTWVAINDPLPAGAAIISAAGVGLEGRRGSQIIQAASNAAAPADNSGSGRWSYAWLAFEESRFDRYRGYFEFLPAGKHRVSYTLRVSQPGTMGLPPTRVEAMYSPDLFGELPNAPWTVSKP
jgi:alpha-2-macroglobulin